MGLHGTQFGNPASGCIALNHLTSPPGRKHLHRPVNRAGNADNLKEN